MATSTPLTISDLEQTDQETSYSIGDIRRKYAYGSSRLSKLNIPQDPLFRILSEKRTDPTPDSIFKYTEERPFLWKRYAYVVAAKTWSGTGNAPVTGYTEADDLIVDHGLTPQTQGTYVAFQMGTDYMSSGNRQNVYGQSNNEITIGATGTLPTFFMENQIIKVSTKSATADLVADDYFTFRIMDVQTSGQYAYVAGKIVHALGSADNKYLCSWPAGVVLSSTYDLAHGHDVGASKTIMEAARSYVVGNAYKKGSGLPDTYETQPFYNRYGATMIQKQSLSMDNTTMATELKLVKNEYNRLWDEKTMLHKWDIGNEIYFSDLYIETGGPQHTEGIASWTLNYGNVFGLTTSKNQDNFLEDMSTLFDPRYNQINKCLFVVSTLYYNWLHKLAGYALQNLTTGIIGTTATYYYYDFAKNGGRTLAGADIFAFSTLYGPMYVLRDPHLDGTQIKMLAVPLGQVKYRPLVGNGKNRDTTIYKGVQTIENTGTDATVDLIQTEFGVEPALPEAWAVWK